MKRCNFEIEAFFGIPMDYENWYEYMAVELTDEQFYRYCEAVKRWQTTDEYKNCSFEGGESSFIERDLPDIYAVVWQQLVEQAPKIWDAQINDYLDQVNIYTPHEVWVELGCGYE